MKKVLFLLIFISTILAYQSPNAAAGPLNMNNSGHYNQQTHMTKVLSSAKGKNSANQQQAIQAASAEKQRQMQLDQQPAAAASNVVTNWTTAAPNYRQVNGALYDVQRSTLFHLLSGTCTATSAH